MSAAPLGAALGQQRTAPCATAGVAALQETVVDRETRVPLRDALVAVTWQEAGNAREVMARTDASGRAVVCIPAALSAVIRVSYRDVRSDVAPLLVAAMAPHAHTTALDVPHVPLHGQVLDHATAAPVANATVRLAHGSVDVTTGPDGRFVLPRVPVGGHELRIEHPSYVPSSTRLDAERSDDPVTTVHVVATAIPLAPIEATTVSRRLDQAGFYDREKRGVGSFIGRAQIDAARVPFASDLLRSVPGVRLVSATGRRGAPRSFTTGRGNCRFRFVVDGTRMLADFELDNLPANHIEGIEVYSGMAQVPAVFRAMTDATGATCGVIAVWMRDGR